jgi:glycosyltransferase involved in cell wall biosynthesis
MKKPSLTIFYQFNPWQSSIGGIQTVIRSFLKYAPDQFHVRLVGTGKPGSSIGKWQEADYAGKLIQFMPLIGIENDNIRKFIPTTIKYTAALFGHNFSSDFMHFHRLEPTLATLNWKGEKTLFINNDIQKQMSSEGSKNAMLWQYFPAGYFALEKFLMNQFDYVYVGNTDSTKFYQQKYPEKANHFLYLRNTVDEETFYSLAPKEKEEQRRQLARQLNQSEATQFILFAGRLHPQKDPILLIRSLAALNMPNIHLLIAGDGELADEVRSEISSLQLSQQVTMLGSLEQEKLADLHRVSSVCILTSVYEGLPLVVLEALACGTPIVTTQSGDTPNFLTSDTGIVAKDRTPAAIAEALEKVFLNSQDYSAESCLRVAQPYIAKTVVQQVYTQMWHRWEQKHLSSV